MKRFATMGLVVLLAAATGGLSGYRLARTSADTPECCKNKEACCPGSQCCPKGEHAPVHHTVSI